VEERVFEGCGGQNRWDRSKAKVVAKGTGIIPGTGARVRRARATGKKAVRRARARRARVRRARAGRRPEVRGARGESKRR